MTFMLLSLINMLKKDNKKDYINNFCIKFLQT